MNPLAMGLLLGAALALFAWSLARRLLPLLALRPEVRWDRPGKRLARLIKFALGQRRFFGRFELVHGLAHVLIFWGFLVLSLNTVQLIGRGFVAGWSLPGLGGGSLGPAYALIKDLFVLAVVAGCLIALARRLLLRPERLTLSGEANLILVWIAVMMLLDVLYGGALRLISPGGTEGAAAFLGRAGAAILGRLGLEGRTPAAEALVGLGLWGHVVLVLAFLNYLPYGKHFHVLTSLPAVFFAGLRPSGALSKLDLESQDEVFGVVGLADFSWKRAWDMYSCTECGRCQALCPAHLSRKPLSPKRLILDERDLLKAQTPLLARAGLARLRGRAGEAAGILEAWAGPRLSGGVIDDEAVWSCTTCGQCLENCPLLIEHPDHVIDLRRGLVMVEGRLPREAVAAFKAWENMSNPWGLAANARGDWLRGLGAPTPDENPDFEYLFYVGCAGSFDDRNQKVAAALVALMRRAGLSFACLGNEEACCGETARRLGNEYLAQTMMAANIEQWRRIGVRKIVTACPHGYNTIKNEYPQLGGRFEVYHHSQLLGRLVEQGRLAVRPERLAGLEAVYHDPCYLGRHNRLFQEPRDLLKAVLGRRPLEAERHGRLSLCCGAGGGRMWLEEKPEQRVNRLRSEQLRASGARTWATACPYCLIMLDDAASEMRAADKIEVLDLAQLLLRAVEPG